MEKQVEVKMLKKQGMKWAVLVSLSHDLFYRNVNVSSTIVKELQMSRAMLESGCFSSCDMNCALDEIERELLQQAASIGGEYFDYWLDLLGRALRDELMPSDVRGLPFIKPIIHDCSFLKCFCEPWQ